MTDHLRSKLIRLAHEKPHLRPHLLPMLREAKDTGLLQRLFKKYKEDHPGSKKPPKSLVEKAEKAESGKKKEKTPTDRDEEYIRRSLERKKKLREEEKAKGEKPKYTPSLDPKPEVHKWDKEKGWQKQAALRKALIRLAHQRPDLRPHLLPLLRRSESH